MPLDSTRNEFYVLDYYYEDADGDDIRIARIIRFDPVHRYLSAETCTSGPFNRGKIERGEITATDEELLNTDILGSEFCAPNSTSTCDDI